jgi:proline iminopeptidase
MTREWWWLPTADGSCWLWVQEFGAGNPVVWLHGGPGYDCEYLVSALQGISGRHILYCQRGSFHSPASIESITAQAHVDDLESLRVALGVERLTIVGHSWGTTLAMLYLAAYPTRVGPLVLAGVQPTQGPYDIDGFDWEPAKAFAERPEIDMQIRAEGLDDKATDPHGSSLVGRIREAGRKMFHIERWREDWPGRFNWAVAKATDDTLTPYDVTEALVKHPFNITVVQGEYDYTDMGAQRAKTQYGFISGVSVHVIPNAGHDVWIDEPAMFRAIVEQGITDRNNAST